MLVGCGRGVFEYFKIKKVPRIVNKNELKFKNIKSWFAFQLIKNANESCKVGYITLGNA